MLFNVRRKYKYVFNVDFKDKKGWLKIVNNINNVDLRAEDLRAIILFVTELAKLAKMRVIKWERFYKLTPPIIRIPSIKSTIIINLYNIKTFFKEILYVKTEELFFKA